MSSLMKVWRDAKRAAIDKSILDHLIKEHEGLISKVNKTMMSLKNQGHTMGSDLRNKVKTGVYVPIASSLLRNDRKLYGSVIELDTIRLDHRITQGLIDSKELSQILNDEEHIDIEFARLAKLCSELIHLSRTIKRVESYKGKIYRNTTFSIKRDDNLIEYH